MKKIYLLIGFNNLNCYLWVVVLYEWILVIKPKLFYYVDFLFVLRKMNNVADGLAKASRNKILFPECDVNLFGFCSYSKLWVYNSSWCLSLLKKVINTVTHLNYIYSYLYFSLYLFLASWSLNFSFYCTPAFETIWSILSQFETCSFQHSKGYLIFILSKKKRLPNFVIFLYSYHSKCAVCFKKFKFRLKIVLKTKV